MSSGRSELWVEKEAAEKLLPALQERRSERTDRQGQRKVRQTWVPRLVLQLSMSKPHIAGKGFLSANTSQE